MAKRGKMDIEKKKCITPIFRVSFPKLFEAESYKGQDPKYSVTMLFDEKADLSDMKRACRNVLIEKFGKDKEDWPKKYRRPFRNGEEKADMPGYGAGITFVTASAKEKNRPQVVGKNLKPIIDESKFYAGCYAHASLIAFWYDEPNPGISFALQNVIKVDDGEPFSGKPSAEDDFKSFKSHDDDEDNDPDDDDDDNDDSDDDDGEEDPF